MMSNKWFFFFCMLLVFNLTSCNSDNADNSGDKAPNATPDTGLTVSGRILVANNVTRDNDVNDVNASLALNNTLNTAQSIPNPTILGGYVNRPLGGPPGRSQREGDVNDFYVADLRAGQRINLFVASENLLGNDLDLALLDANGAILNASVGEGGTETLSVPANGRYYIQIQAYQGGANYVLSIGQDITVTSLGMTLSDDFASGEVIVQLQPVEETLKSLGTLSTLDLTTDGQDDTSRRVLLTFTPGQVVALGTDESTDCVNAPAALEGTFATPELQEKYQTLLVAKCLRKRADVVEASPNYWLQALRTPSDSLYRYQWDYPLMNLPQAWDVTRGDQNVIVATIDTGVLLSHPDLQGKLVAGYDFIADSKVALDGNGLDSNPDDPGDQSRGGSTFHGTHVAGTIGALTDNRSGIAGIGWFTRIMPLRVLGKAGAGKDYDIEQAIRFAAGLANDSKTVPTQRADIINLSLGGPVISRGFQQAVNEARAAGVIIVAAAGNDGTNTPIFPASLDGVISVSAVDINKKRSSYSNYGEYVDVAAPGGDNTPDVNGDGVPDGIISTVGTDTSGRIEYSFASSVGTSMAAPHIAGVVALMKAVNRNLTPQNVDALISSGKITEDLGLRGRDDSFGYGLIDAHKAVLAAAGLGNSSIPEPAPQLVSSHKALNFGLSNSSITLTLSNGGGGNLRVQSIAADASYLTLTPSTVDANGLGDYAVIINRSRLETGTYSATITAVSSANTLKIPVILQVGNTNIAGDAGYHYILLVNADTLETVLETRANAVNGVYDFRFTQVPAGKYIIAAGSDFNNDGYICDVGEACGAFLTLARPTAIEVTNTNRSQVDFNTGFNVNFLSKALMNSEEVVIPQSGFARLSLLHSIE